MTPETVDILLRAADRVQFKGWCQRRWGSGDEMCGERALIRVAAESGRSMSIHLIDAVGAAQRLVRKLSGDLSSRLIDYNDAAGRTAAEVAHLLRGAALESLWSSEVPIPGSPVLRRFSARKSGYLHDGPVAMTR